MPRSRSIFIQSERVLRRSPLALTWPARVIAPPNSSSFSVSVVLPASGWEMIAKVRRRATSSASGERGGDSAVTAMSDIGPERLAGKTGAIKDHLAIAQQPGKPHILPRRTTFSSTHHARGRPCSVWRVCHGVGCVVHRWSVGNRLGHRPQIHRRLYAAGAVGADVGGDGR